MELNLYGNGFKNTFEYKKFAFKMNRLIKTHKSPVHIERKSGKVVKQNSRESEGDSLELIEIDDDMESEDQRNPAHRNECSD